MAKPANITRLLQKIAAGDTNAEADLFPLVYAELHRMAAALMRRERSGHTLQPTALVNDAYLRLVDQAAMGIHNRNHFFATAARVMRRILVDHARRRNARKRGGGAWEVALDDVLTYSDNRSPMIEALDEALTNLAVLDERQAKVVEWRFFGGMTEEEIADVLGVSARTVKRDWTMARAWLYGELSR
jgi:RNA polymerase sigma factor (TIGR02999 family)